MSGPRTHTHTHTPPHGEAEARAAPPREAGRDKTTTTDSRRPSSAAPVPRASCPVPRPPSPHPPENARRPRRGPAPLAAAAGERRGGGEPRRPRPSPMGSAGVRRQRRRQVRTHLGEKFFVPRAPLRATFLLVCQRSFPAPGPLPASLARRRGVGGSEVPNPQNGCQGARELRVRGEAGALPRSGPGPARARPLTSRGGAADSRAAAASLSPPPPPPPLPRATPGRFHAGEAGRRPQTSQGERREERGRRRCHIWRGGGAPGRCSPPAAPRGRGRGGWGESRVPAGGGCSGVRPPFCVCGVCVCVFGEGRGGGGAVRGAALLAAAAVGTGSSWGAGRPPAGRAAAGGAGRLPAAGGGGGAGGAEEAPPGDLAGAAPGRHGGPSSRRATLRGPGRAAPLRFE